MVRSAASRVVWSAEFSIRTEECSSSLALSAIFLLCCSTTLAVCLVASVGFGLVAVGAIDQDNARGGRRVQPRVRQCAEYALEASLLVRNERYALAALALLVALPTPPRKMMVRWNTAG